MQSFRTSLAGFAAIAAAIAHIAKVYSEQGIPGLATIDWLSTGSAIAAGWGLIHARDHKVSSEQAGVAPFKVQVEAPRPRTPYSSIMLLIVLAIVCAGCAITRTTQTEIDADGTKRKTGFTGLTFFDSKSELARARLSTTDKTQGATISGLSQESSGSNAVATLRLVVEGAAIGASKSVIPVP